MKPLSVIGSTMIALLVGSILPIAMIEANGGKGKKTLYEGSAHLGTGTQANDVTFTAELERVMFAISSVASKYKVVCIKIRNDSDKSLGLLADRDKIEFLFGSEAIPGFLQLSSRDPELWNRLDAATRNSLAYPTVVEDREEVNVFAFVEKPELAQVPSGFRFTIDSLPSKQVSINDRDLRRAE